MSGSGVAIGSTLSYPTGVAPEDHEESSNPAPCHAVPVGARAAVPFWYFQVLPAGKSVLLGGLAARARQLPPRLLSKVGLISSIEYPGESPTVGQGKPSW